MTKNVLLTGGTGFIGKHLTDVLIENGFTVSILSRSNRKNTSSITYYKWNLKDDFIEKDAILNADYIVHLAGEGIVEKRWTKRRKKAILESRTKPIELIFAILKENNKTLDAFISASAVGIYGAFTSQEICTENTPPANDFLGTTCQKWEAAADQITSLGIRTVKIRTGIVLGKGEGFLKKITPGFKAGFGAILGSGKQYIPWIHVEDLCQIYLKAIVDIEMQGAYNATITDNTTNATLSRILAHLYGYSIWLPNIPAFLIKLGLGEMSIAVLEGQRISSEKIQKAGFEFQYKDIEATLSTSMT
jgi:uncharacterized protein